MLLYPRIPSVYLNQSCLKYTYGVQQTVSRVQIYDTIIYLNWESNSQIPTEFTPIVCIPTFFSMIGLVGASRIVAKDGPVTLSILRVCICQLLWISNILRTPSCRPAGADSNMNLHPSSTHAMLSSTLSWYVSDRILAVVTDTVDNALHWTFFVFLTSLLLAVLCYCLCCAAPGFDPRWDRCRASPSRVDQEVRHHRQEFLLQEHNLRGERMGAPVSHRRQVPVIYIL